MRRIVCLLIAAAAMAAPVGTASAADLPAKASAYKTPPAVATPNWSGFYVGIGLGGRWDSVDGSVSAATNNGANILCAPGTIGPCTATRMDSAAFRPSAYFGYNWQISPLLVAGVEGDVGWANNRKTLNGAIYPGGNFPFYLTQRSDDSFTFKSSWDGGVRGRFGYLVNPSTLLFVTGGAQFMEIETESHCGVLSDCEPGAFATLFAPANISHTRTMVGGTVGGGIEWMLTPSWLLRAEYRFADFGKAIFTDTRITPAGPTSQVATYQVDVFTHTALIGIAYKFDTDAAR